MLVADAVAGLTQPANAPDGVVVSVLANVKPSLGTIQLLRSFGSCTFSVTRTLLSHRADTRSCSTPDRSPKLGEKTASAVRKLSDASEATTSPMPRPSPVIARRLSRFASVAAI